MKWGFLFIIFDKKGYSELKFKKVVEICTIFFCYKEIGISWIKTMNDERVKAKKSSVVCELWSEPKGRIYKKVEVKDILIKLMRYLLFVFKSVFASKQTLVKPQYIRL